MYLCFPVTVYINFFIVMDETGLCLVLNIKYEPREAENISWWYIDRWESLTIV